MASTIDHEIFTVKILKCANALRCRTVKLQNILTRKFKPQIVFNTKTSRSTVLQLHVLTEAAHSYVLLIGSMSSSTHPAVSY